jgi:hypothetical protein
LRNVHLVLLWTPSSFFFVNFSGGQSNNWWFNNQLSPSHSWLHAKANDMQPAMTILAITDKSCLLQTEKVVSNFHQRGLPLHYLLSRYLLLYWLLLWYPNRNPLSLVPCHEGLGSHFQFWQWSWSVWAKITMNIKSSWSNGAFLGCASTTKFSKQQLFSKRMPQQPSQWFVPIDRFKNSNCFLDSFWLADLKTPIVCSVHSNSLIWELQSPL